MVGLGGSGVESNYFSYEDKYRKIYHETANENIFFINKGGVNLVKRYLAFIEIEVQKETIGYIVIDLKQKKAISTYVYPELLVDKNYTQPPETKNYSYAVYEDNQLIYSVGNYNYEKNYDSDLFRDEQLFIEGLAYGGYEHLALEGGFKKRVVVSAPHYSWVEVFSKLFFPVFAPGSLYRRLYRGVQHYPANQRCEVKFCYPYSTLP
ncbi:MAG: hypothetical protein HC880_06740 [Bacteroidia bacterium]|nr:hypothetical protein [Bacteroidia bacterium]